MSNIVEVPVPVRYYVDVGTDESERDYLIVVSALVDRDDNAVIHFKGAASVMAGNPYQIIGHEFPLDYLADERCRRVAPEAVPGYWKRVLDAYRLEYQPEAPMPGPQGSLDATFSSGDMAKIRAMAAEQRAARVPPDIIVAEAIWANPPGVPGPFLNTPWLLLREVLDLTPSQAQIALRDGMALISRIAEAWERVDGEKAGGKLPDPFTERQCQKGPDLDR